MVSDTMLFGSFTHSPRRKGSNRGLGKRHYCININYIRYYIDRRQTRTESKERGGKKEGKKKVVYVKLRILTLPLVCVSVVERTVNRILDDSL